MLLPSVGVSWPLAANCSTAGSNWELTGGRGGVGGVWGTYKTGSSWVNILPGSEGVEGAPSAQQCGPVSVRPPAGQWGRFPLDSFQADGSGDALILVQGSTSAGAHTPALLSELGWSFFNWTTG